MFGLSLAARTWPVTDESGRPLIVEAAVHPLASRASAVSDSRPRRRRGRFIASQVVIGATVSCAVISVASGVAPGPEPVRARSAAKYLGRTVDPAAARSTH